MTELALHFTESGTTGEPSILFLHGIGTSGWMWKRQIADLSSFHCLNVDLPGHGRSNRLEWASLADAADRVADLIMAHATKGIANVVGLSLGGHVALELLARQTHLVDRAIVSGVTYKPMPNLAFLKPQLWLVSALMHRPSVMNMAIKSMQVPSDMQNAFKENLLAMSMRTYRRIFAEVAHWHVPPSLRAVNNSTLIAAGGAESKIIIDAVHAISKLMPNASGVLAPGLRHGWNVEDSALFSEMVRAWITGTPLPTALRQV